MGDRVATLMELERQRAARHALPWQLLGLVLIVVAVGALAGIWWAVGVVGVLLFAGGVLREAGWL